MHKFIVVILCMTIAFFIAGKNHPALAFTQEDSFITPKYTDSLVEALSYSRFLCTKDKEMCLKSVDMRKKEDSNVEKKEIVYNQPVILASNKVPYSNTQQPDQGVLSSAPEQINLNADILYDMVNQVRSQNGLESLQKDDNLCSIAHERASELPAEFEKGTLHSGLYNRDLPYYITENAIFARSEEVALNWWLHSPVHRNSILGDSKFSCLKCIGKACSQVFTQYIPKAI